MIRSFFNALDKDYLIKFVLLFLLDLALSQFATELYRSGTAPTVIYLPGAIGLVALFLWGYGFWPAIALATFFSPLLNGALPLNAAGASLAHTAQALMGAYLLRRYDFQPLLGRIK
ncbi:hypothetical protein KW798_03515, partial [Candidatus Parcubacteria bacterium]|nr:hypothetical protein [Candidatus Parcubacteria bacterium]